MGDEWKQEMRETADGLHDLASTVNNLGAKFDKMTAKVNRLVLLTPVASKLADLPEKVVAFQASTYDNTEQICALNLAVIRVESAHRDGKAPVRDDDAAAAAAATNGPPKRGAKPPLRTNPPPREPLPRDLWCEQPWEPWREQPRDP